VVVSSWMNLLNPFVHSTKKFVYELIGANRYANHEAILEQLARSFNQKEYEQFGKFVAEVYEAGYMRSVEEHQVELKKMGLKVFVRPAPAAEPKNPIFNQKSQPDNL
jgi:hypothetical protein